MSAKRRTDVNYSAALYMRLSKDDENTGESGSIINQRKMLRAYAKEHRYMVYDEYIDDGVSGTTFDRPGFKRIDVYKRQLHDVPIIGIKRLAYFPEDSEGDFFIPAELRHRVWGNARGPSQIGFAHFLVH